MDLFTVYYGFLHSIANCILVQLYPLGIIALSLRTAPPFWKYVQVLRGQAEQDQHGKQKNCSTGNREAVGGKIDVLAPETVSVAILRGGGKNETFLENQHSLSARHNVKLISGDN